MANTNSPFGFKHLGFAQGGAAATFGLRRVKVAYNYGTALYAGDVVEDLGSGYVGQYGSAGSGNVIGVVRSFEYLSTSLGRKVWSTYLPTTDHANDIDALVIPIQGVPPQLFLVQAYLLPFAITHLGTKVVPTAGTGSVIGGRGKSGMTVTAGSGTTNTYPFRVVDLYSNIAAKGVNGIDDTSNYNIVVVQSEPYEAVGI
jgi:hypothetical protein